MAPWPSGTGRGRPGIAEEPNHEIVVGTVVGAPGGWRPSGRPTPGDFKALHEPGFALAAMNFIIEEAGPDVSTVTTETRVYATESGNSLFWDS
jgi:hypothetical protein